VVLVTGSGPQDRDEALLGHRPFAVLADHLTRRRIAVLRYDDRGVARSTGSFADATSADFAEDARAAVGYLRTRREVAPRKIGIAGHSEGGLIAPMVAVRDPDVSFLVLLAGRGCPATRS
jgi:alpha/beta superfamily hydrolase